MKPLRLVLTCLAAGCALAANAGPPRPPHNFDLLDVAWHVSINEANSSIRGDVTNTLAPTEDNLTQIILDCGPLRIERVTVDGIEVRTQWKPNLLAVDLPKRVRKNQRLKVRVVYSGSPTAGVYFVPAERAYPAKTGMVYTQGEMEDTRYWIPTHDFPDDKATLEGWIEVPAGYYALSNGRLVDVKKNGANSVYHWKMDKPQVTYLISFVAGLYSEGKEMLGGLPVLWYVPKGLEDQGKAAFGGTAQMIDFYNKLTGFKYPYSKFSQAAVADYMFGGMENVTAVTQTIGTLHKPENEPISNSAGLVAHELAHQWFGDTLTCESWAHAWLNEGFASFLPHFWFEHSRGQDAYDLGRFDTFVGAIGSQASTHRPVVSDKWEEAIDVFDGQIYGGGAARLFTLMNQIGEKTFWRGVNTYLNENKFKTVNTPLFFATMSRVAKRDLTPFMQQFFYTDAYPNLSVSREGSTIHIRQPQPAFDLDLPISFLGADRIESEQIVHIHGSDTTLQAPGEGFLAVLDYPVSAMAVINYNLMTTPEDLVRIWRLAPNAAAKMNVMNRFGSRIPADTLLQLAMDEKSPLVLERLLPHLRANGVPFLLDLTHGWNKQLAYAGANALGSFMNEPSVVARMNELWTKEPNEFIRLSALHALLTIAKDDALAKSAWQKESQGDMYRQAAFDWWFNHDKPYARRLALEVVNGNSYPGVRNLAIGYLGTLKDAPGSREVFNALARVAVEPSFNPRSAAINALVTYGDKAAIPIIEPATHVSLHYLRRTAERAVQALNGK